MVAWAISARAAALHADALVWDNHACLPMNLERNLECIGQLERYRTSGVDFLSLNIGYGEMDWTEHVRVAAAMRHWIKRHPEHYKLVERIEDIDTARAAGQLAVSFDIEGAAAVQDQLSLVQLFYDLGVRWMLIAYNRSNRIGGGCHDEDPGLSGLGRELLSEMARVGMVCCCSHTGYRTALDVCAASERPVILSHSNPRALHDHPRNVPDELIHACAATGGVIGINGIGIFLGGNDVSTANLARHVDYVAQLVGPRHVGLGLDYMFDKSEVDSEQLPATFPRGYGYDGPIEIVQPEQLPELTETLLDMGYADDEVRGILGANLLRVAHAVWR